MWTVPASPYENTAGALDAIRFARETRRPFLGTCGGFQHALIEFARRRLPAAEFRVGEMEALPYDDDTFDLVTGFNSFFFADDVVSALSEGGRVAKSGRRS